MSRNKERRPHILRKPPRREGEGRNAYRARQCAIWFTRKKAAERRLKRQPIRSNADRLRHRLILDRVPQALDVTLKKYRRTGEPDARPGLVAAFVTVLCDLSPNCEAAVAAVAIAEEIGMPLDGLRDRAVVLEWLRQPPSTVAGSLAGERLVETGCVDTAPVTSQPDGIELHDPNAGLPLPTAADQAATRLQKVATV